MILVTAAEMRRLDELTVRRYGTPGHVLMERAGSGATRVLLEQFPHVRRQRVVVVAGKGNNGGDGFVIARLLRRKSVRAEVVLLDKSTEVTGDAARMLKALRRIRVPVVEVATNKDLPKLSAKLAGAALLVDAIFGTGLNATVDGRYAEILHLMNASGVPILAVDMPSGLDADLGTPLGVAIQAEATATFGFAKVGQVIHPGVEHVGTLAVVDIGIAPQAVAEVQPRTRLLDGDEVAPLVPRRAPEAHKGSCGHVLVIAGSRGHTGAALLAAHAACRSGAGLTTLAGPASLNAVYCGGVPEVMTAPLHDVDGLLEFNEAEMRNLLHGKTAVIVGPGMGTHGAAETLVRFLLAEVALPMVIDADALTCLARDLSLLKGARAHALLTPHPGEMARLLACETAAVQADRVGMARSFAAAHGCVLVLKGARSVIAEPGGAVSINSTGNPGMASGGMGDALCGILGGLLAQGLTPADAACLGVYLHGEVADHVAATRGQVGLLASDVIGGIPTGLARLLEAWTWAEGH
jgi:NAD(P)H-hydrate epimerase